MKHKRKHYRPIPFQMSTIVADYVNRHLRMSFDAFLSDYFPDAPKSLTDRLTPTNVEWEIANFDNGDPFFYFKFICDIDNNLESNKVTGTLSLSSEMTHGLDVGHYRSIQVVDENQECFECLFYKDIQTAVRVCELLRDGKESEAHKIAFAQPDYPAAWAYEVEEAMKRS